MDEPLSWKSIGDSLDRMGRGARTALADALDMDRSQLARLLRSDRYPDMRQGAIISAYLEGRPPAEVVRLPTRPSAMKVPLYGFAAASTGDRIAFNEGQILDWIELPRGMTLTGDFFIIQVMGSSMEPRYWPGERKLVQRNVPPARNQDAVIEFHDGTGVLKTYQREKDGWLFGHQYNPDTEVKYESSTVKALHALLPL